MEICTGNSDSTEEKFGKFVRPNKVDDETMEVRNSRVTKWSYEIELRKTTSQLNLLSRKFS